MKNWIDKLKGLDYKKLGIEHGEKLAFGCVILIVLFALGVGTSWSHFDQDPQTLKDNVAQASQSINSAPWPKTHQDRFPAGNQLTNRVQQMLQPLDSKAFAFGDVAPYLPLYKPKEKIKNPGWMAIEKLIASYARVVLAIPREGSMDGGDYGQPPGIVPPGSGIVLPGSGAPPGGGKGGIPMPGEAAGGDLDGGLTNNSAYEARGERVVAVRGVFPLNRQIIRMMRAMNISNPQVALAQLEFQDFEIERQIAVEGSDPWTGDWEKINLGEAFKILDEGSWIADVVDTSITEGAFTEPLLQLLSGPGGTQKVSALGGGGTPGADAGGDIDDNNDVGDIGDNEDPGNFDVSDLGADNLWGALATHPSVKEYHLTPAGQEEQALFNEAVTKSVEEEKANTRKVGTLLGLQRNLRKDRDNALDSQQDMKKVMLYAKQGMGKDQKFKLGVTASGNLLLFRFFDFTVEPGRAYRYRVRLEIVNPNFGKPLQDVEDPSVVQEEFPKTPWSDPTGPVVVPVEGDVFVSNVNEAGAYGPEAVFDLLQWNEKTGTAVHGVLRRQLGQLIDGLADKKTKVVDLGMGGVEERNVEFRTGSVFVDVAGDRKLSRDLHPDLDISFTGMPGIVERVLLTNEYGDLEPLVSRGDRAQSQQRQIEDHKAFLMENEAAKGLDAGADPLNGVDGGEIPGAQGKKKRRNRSSRKRPGQRPPGTGVGTPPGRG